MSETRNDIERLQMELRDLEASALPDAYFAGLADALEQEARAYQTVLEKNEKRAEAAELGGSFSSRLAIFAFALLVTTPFVGVLGSAFARHLRHQTEIAVLLIIVGASLIVAITFSALRHLITHRASAEWKRVRSAMKEVEELRAMINDSRTPSR